MSPNTTGRGTIVISDKELVNFSNDLFKILVGPKDAPEEFHLHAFYLTNRSAFFRAAINGNWKESAERTIKLPAEEPHVFRHYLSLIFFNKLPIKPEVDAGLLIGNAMDTVYRRLFNLYILCDRLQDIAAKNVIITACVEQANSKPGNDDSHFFPEPEEINIIYENTAGDCGMRRMLVDMWAYTRCGVEGNEAGRSLRGEERFNLSFLFELARRMANLVETKELVDVNWCGCLLSAPKYLEGEPGKVESEENDVAAESDGYKAEAGAGA